MLAQAVGDVSDDPVAIRIPPRSEALTSPATGSRWRGPVGRAGQAQPLFSILSPGPAPEGVNEAGTWYPKVLLRPEPLTPYEPG